MDLIKENNDFVIAEIEEDKDNWNKTISKISCSVHDVIDNAINNKDTNVAFCNSILASALSAQEEDTLGVLPFTLCANGLNRNSEVIKTFKLENIYYNITVFYDGDYIEDYKNNCIKSNAITVSIKIKTQDQIEKCIEKHNIEIKQAQEEPYKQKEINAPFYFIKSNIKSMDLFNFKYLPSANQVVVIQSAEEYILFQNRIKNKIIALQIAEKTVNNLNIILRNVFKLAVIDVK